LFSVLAEQSRQVIENTGEVSTGDRPSETQIGLGRTARNGQESPYRPLAPLGSRHTIDEENRSSRFKIRRMLHTFL